MVYVAVKDGFTDILSQFLERMCEHLGTLQCLLGCRMMQIEEQRPVPGFVTVSTVLCCVCSRLAFTVYAVNRLPFVKASCRSLNAPPSHGRAVHHPFVAFFTSFARAKAAACWLSESGEEVYVHRFRANKSVEGRWHPFRWPLNPITSTSVLFRPDRPGDKV